MSPLRWLHFSWWPHSALPFELWYLKAWQSLETWIIQVDSTFFVRCHWQQLSVVSLPTLHKRVLCTFFFLLVCSQMFTWLPVAQSVWHYHTTRVVLLLYSPGVVDLHCYLHESYSFSTTFTTCVGSTIRWWHDSCACWTAYHSLS